MSMARVETVERPTIEEETGDAARKAASRDVETRATARCDRDPFQPIGLHRWCRVRVAVGAPPARSQALACTWQP